MTRCTAFLRAVNVGGRFVKMEALAAAFEAMCLTKVQTFIASGNVIFDTRACDLAAIVAHAAFDAADAALAKTQVVGFLASLPEATRTAAFDHPAHRFDLNERELHWLSTEKQSDTTFSNAAFERAFKARTTFRNITTLRKLLAKLE